MKPISYFLKVAYYATATAQETNFPINCFSKCKQICRFLQICSCLLKKSLMENFISCAVSLLDKFNSNKIQLKFKMETVGNIDRR